MAISRWLASWAIVLLLPFSNLVHASSLRVAVAANFAPLLKELIVDFEQQHQTRIKLSSASTGVLYQQILHGAPFDIFLSADNKRTALLIEQNKAVLSSQKTYAIGQLALWHNSTEQASVNTLKTTDKKLAIANPKTAPYGQAAKQALSYLELWQLFDKRLIIGSNINQTYQQVHSKAVTLGLVSYSQLIMNNMQHRAVLLPRESYQALSQEMVILSNSKQQALAQIFSDYLLSPAVQKKIVDSGYLAANSSLNEG